MYEAVDAGGKLVLLTSTNAATRNAALPIAKHANFLQAQEQLRPVVHSHRYDRLTPAAHDV
jgi:hypothetical protein